MGKKLKFPFLIKATETTDAGAGATSSSWPWQTCVSNPKTLSFRAHKNQIFKTMNSAYLEQTTIEEILDSTPDSVLISISNSFDESFSCASRNDESNIEMVIRDLRSDRLFFEPGETSSILEEAKTDESFPYKESTVMVAMASRDPCVDFRLSMEEMVEAYGLKNWECLEQLLTCYLRVNSKKNHGYIVGAFVDLLVHLEFVASSSKDHDEHCSSSSSANQYSFTSPFSFSSSSSSTNPSTSPCVSSSLEHEDQINEGNVDTASSESFIAQQGSSSNTVLPLDA